MSAKEKAPPKEAAPAVEIAGTVQHLFCQRPQFCAGILIVKGREVKFSLKGYVKTGEPVTFSGQWQVHPKFGRQFAATEVVYSVPTDPAGLVRWLGWYADGLGPVKSQKLVDEFGIDLMRLCGEDPGQVAACAGIPIEYVHRIAEAWSKFAGRIAAQSQLAAWGMTQHQTEVVLERIGGGAVALLKEDPYAILGLVDGFGWTKCDELAAKLGIVGTDYRRVRAAVAFVVKERQGEGSTAVRWDIACELVAEKLQVEDAKIAAAGILDARDAGRIVLVGVGELFDPSAGGTRHLATPSAHKHESTIWSVLKTARGPNPAMDGAECDEQFVREGYGRFLLPDGREVVLEPEQSAAVAMAASNRISVVTGGAGVGKTLIARVLFKLFDDGDVPVMLCAPTGKAARRLTEVIGAGVEALTIHRLLCFNGASGHFGHNAENPLPDGVVIADEASMIDADLGYRLLSSLGPNTALVLIGDPNQLPPVGPGAILRDVLAYDLAPVARLDHCHRQAGTLKHNCAAVLAGHVEPWVTTEDPSPWIVGRKADTPAKVLKVIEDLYLTHLAKWGFDPIAETQVMTAKHDGQLGTKRVNLLLQRLHQRALGLELPEPAEDDHHLKAILYVGDKVIQTVNNYTLDVMNGHIGRVVAVKPLAVDYDGREIVYTNDRAGEVSLAYCLTPHKMQGSEIPCAVTIVPKAHAFMQHRHWLYTAVTRAQRTAVIIGDDDGIRRAVEKVELNRRETLLQVFARQERDAR